MSKTFLFQTIQFSISTQFSSILPIDRSLSGATNPGQSGPGSDCNEGVLRIHQSSSNTRAPPSDCLVSYLDHWLRESYPFAEKQSMYSVTHADWVIYEGFFEYLTWNQFETSWSSIVIQIEILTPYGFNKIRHLKILQFNPVGIPFP